MKYRTYSNSMDRLSVIAGLLLILILVSLAFSHRAFSAPEERATDKPFVRTGEIQQFYCTLGGTYSGTRVNAAVTPDVPTVSVPLNPDVSVRLTMTKSRSLIIDTYVNGVKKYSATMQNTNSSFSWSTSEVTADCYRHTRQ